METADTFFLMTHDNAPIVMSSALLDAARDFEDIVWFNVHNKFLSAEEMLPN